ncbi:MAG: hypothetical protein JNK02_10280 [Planctomycetes bacterium]|nr:hypothetical protein [Planctomycetota bacterium]
MKFPFIALALLAAPALPATAAPTPAVQEASASLALRPRFNAAVEALRARAEAAGLSRTDYQKVVDEWKAAAAAYEVPKTAELHVGTRVLERLMELERLAQSKMYELLELDILKDQAIDAELEYVLNRIKSGIAAKRQPSRIDFEAVIANLTARADAAKAWNPEIDAIVGRLRHEMESLMAKAKASPIAEKDLEPAMDIAKEIRVSNVLVRLEKRAMEKKAIEADYGDVLDEAKRLPLPSSEREELVKKVQARLDEIREAVKGGRITREQFTQLRDLLMTRARAASSTR